MNRKHVMTASLLFMSISAQANENLILTCPIKKQYVCSFENCTIIQPLVTIELRLVENDAEYSRCDKKGCDKYPSSITQSGIYTLVSATGKSSSIKLDLKSMSFMETSSLGLSSFTAFGQCHPK